MRPIEMSALRKRALRTLTAALLAGVISTGNTAQAANLVGWWNMDDGFGNTATDSSGSNRDGTLMNFDVSPAWDTNLTGLSDGITLSHGLYFSGGFNDSGAPGVSDTDYVNLDAHASAFNALNTGSISLWYRRDAGGDPEDNSVVGLGGESGVNSYFRLQLENMNSGTPVVRVTNHDGATGNSFDVNTADDGNWHNMVFTSTGGATPVSKFYLDGELTSTDDLPFLDLATWPRMALGVTPRDDDFLWYFQGTMGDVRIYDDVLSQNAVNYISNSDNYGDGLALELDPQLVIDRTTGNITLINSAGGNYPFIGYSITSASGSLNPGNGIWTSIAETYDLGGNKLVDPNDNWTELTDPDVHTDLSEFETGPVFDGATLSPNQEVDLGNAWIQSPTEDLMMEILIDDGTPQGETRLVEVVFTGGSGPFMLYDLDFDGDFDDDDFFNEFVPSYGTDTSLLSPAEQYQAADFNGDGVTNSLDFFLFNDAYIAANPGSSGFSLSSVPEPASALLLLLGSLGLLFNRKT